MKMPISIVHGLLVVTVLLESAAFGALLDDVADYGEPGQQNAARLHRAGYPYCIARWARFTYGDKYCGYYVGGGATFYGNRPGLLRGERRYWHEGTWGMDYAPWYSRVRLQWFHGRRRQDGDGQYEPDGHNNPVIPLFFR